jgi:hypothetical protein
MSQEHTIQTIITALNETDERPREQIAAIVRALGEERALAVLVEANEVERTGGMMLPDGSRRRTPGGVFFAIARRRLSPEDRDAIFPKSPSPKREDEKKDDEKTDEPGPTRPIRRHVRLISVAEPETSRTQSRSSSTGAAGESNAKRASSQLEIPLGTNGAETGKPEVKLVRLDRRRIVSLPTPKQEDPKTASPSNTSRAAERVTPPARRTAQAVREPDEVDEDETTERAVWSPAGLDRAVERAQVKKRISSLLEGLDVEQRRLVLLDLLAEISDDLPVLVTNGAPTPELRSRILATVGDRLGISLGQLALTIYGADTPGNRRRVKALTSDADD